jgi:aminoglycoside 2'-N-acetyltransferase I
VTAAVAVRRSSELSEIERVMLWALLTESFAGDFDEHDWEHAVGGLHVVVSQDEQPVAHAAVVSRTMIAGGLPFSCGYVEAVATRPRYRKEGHATSAMSAVGTIISRDFELGALSTGSHGFYERLGWERWRGPTYVQSPDGRIRTPDDDDSVMIMRTSRSLFLDSSKPLVCEWRTGDVW